MDNIKKTTAIEERTKQLGFKPQRELLYNKLLPYQNELDEESQQMLAEIKANLGKAIILRETRPAACIWVARLGRYIQLYGFKFSKEDHVAFVNLIYECLTIPNLEPYLVYKYARVLFLLLKKKRLLSPEDVTFKWQPLYHLIERIMETKDTQLGMFRYFSTLEPALDSLIHVAKYYFPDTATQEILDKFKPQVYPISGSGCDFEVFEWFLPTALPPSKSHLGYKLWLSDFMGMWSACNNGAVWEPEMLTLIAQLAWDNMGYIDWEPYIPEMFARFIRYINLPVDYKNEPSTKFHKTDPTAMSVWIVAVLGGGGEGQKYLEKFLKAIETYFHPANFGLYSFKLREFLYKLPYTFVQRLHWERYEKPSWQTPTPDSHKLTEEDIDLFVASFKPLAMRAIFSLVGCADVVVSLHQLATLRPKAICPDLIERFYSTVDSLTEPHKLTSLLQGLVGVALPIIHGRSWGYSEGTTHVIPMLMASLPGIDPNDFKKCILTFQFIQTYVSLVPLIDCSKASETWSDLTEEEEAICTMTADFEDFVCQFFDRIFVLVESSTLESTRLDKMENKRSRTESMSERALANVCFSVLAQTSPEIFQSALKKLVAFVTGRILETNVAGHFIASLATSFSRVNSKETFKALLPRLCNSILALTESDDVQNEHNLDNELLYNLLILSAMVDCRSEGLVPYIEPLTTVLDKCLYLVSCEGFAIASRLLNNILITLTSIYSNEHRSVNYELVTGDAKHLPVRDWGQKVNFWNINMTWHVPDKNEVEAAQALLNRYLPRELQLLERHMSGEEVLSRTRVLISLHIVFAAFGAEAMLPIWDEPPVVLFDSCLKSSSLAINLGSKHSLTMPDGSNVRHVIASTMDRLQKFVLINAEDDTKTFFQIIKITERLLLNRMRSPGDGDINPKNHRILKKVLLNHLEGGKQRVRTILQDRVILLHDNRCDRASPLFTETHKMLMLNMLSLSCSHYSQVRTKAQASLCRGLDYFAFSYTLLLPKLYENLKLNTGEFHETFKGSLYVLLNPKRTPVVTRHDWNTVLQLWPALVRSQPSEKLSVIKLFDNLKDSVNKHFPTIAISLDIPDRCVEAAQQLWKTFPIPSEENPSSKEIADGKQALLDRNERNLKNYTDLLEQLCEAAEDSKLHWRHHALAICFLRDLVHPELSFPPRVVQVFLDTLISDSIELRKIAIKSVVHILKQQKRKHKKITVDLNTLTSEPLPEICAPGIRPDNLWLQYKGETVPRSAEAWDAPRFKHSNGFSFLAWPKELELYAPSNEQPPLDRDHSDLLPEERPIVEFFTNEEKIAKLIHYFTIEEKKGFDKFNGYRFVLFKSLFRNHGDTFLPLFKPHLEKLVAERLESHQRCATEIISGIIRGCKHWPYEKVESLWNYLIPLTQAGVLNMTEETIQDWGICFSTASQNRDPNRNHWLLESLMNPIRNETSFMECGRLYALQSALNQQEWRVSELYHRLLEHITPYLDHPFESVRRRIASVLTNIFQPSVEISGGKTLGPTVSAFMANMEESLQLLYTIPITIVEGGPKVVRPPPPAMKMIREPVPNGLILPNMETNQLITAAQMNNRTTTQLGKQLQSLYVNQLKSGILQGPIPPAKGVSEMTMAISNLTFKGEEPRNGFITHDEPIEKALRLFKTLVQWITGSLNRSNNGALKEYYTLYPLMCLLENYEQDDELRPICSRALSCLASAAVSPNVIPHAFAAIQKVMASGSWWAKNSNLEFLQVFIFYNMPFLRSRPEWTTEATNVVLALLNDSRLEVREKAAQVLAGLLHCDFIPEPKQLLMDLKRKLGRRSKTNKDPSQLVARHSAILGLCAFINSSPYDVPEFVPQIFSLLGDHMNDPQPIPSTIRKTLGDFKRTHHDEWESHKLKFTEEELEVLNDMTVPPSYCT